MFSYKKMGFLHLLPNLLDDSALIADHLPPSLRPVVLQLDGLIAESEKKGRRFLSHFMTLQEARAIPIAVYQGKGSEKEWDFLLSPIRKGETWGLISDAGLPCIADPGSELVLYAHRKAIPVQAWTGPCSFVLALMLSGLPAQKFHFHGYPPREDKQLQKALCAWEEESRKSGTTHLFMQAPYQNQGTFTHCLRTLKESCLLCIAADLTLISQYVATKTVKEWKTTQIVEIHKKPTVFLLFSKGST